MSTIVVSFRPLSRNRYQPQVWRGEYRLSPKNGKPTRVKVLECYPAIPQPQLNAFRNRFAPKRPKKEAVTYPAQRPAWQPSRYFLSDGYYKVTCGCGAGVPVPRDAEKVTCASCGARTPIKRNYL